MNLLDQQIFSARLTVEPRQREVHPFRPQQQRQCISERGVRNETENPALWWQVGNRNTAKRLAILGGRARDGGEGERRENKTGKKTPPQQLHDPSKTKCEAELVGRLGACGEGAGEQQLQRQHLIQQLREQWEQSEDCCSCHEENAQLPPIVLLLHPPQRSPPPPPPPLQSSSHLARPRNARDILEPVGSLCAGEGGEQKCEGVSWPARAGRKVETATRAWLNTFWQNSMPGLLRPFARACLTRDTSHPTKENKSANVGDRGGVDIIGLWAEDGRKRRSCPTRAKVKEKRLRCQQSESHARQEYITLLMSCC